MKKISSVFMAAVLIAGWTRAADSTTNTEVALPVLAAARGNALSPEDRTQYAGLIRGEIESNTELKLLTALADEQLKRSAESRQTGALDKSKWQAELDRELRDKISRVLARLNDATKQRLAFEASHGSLPAPVADLGPLQEAKALKPPELAYVTKLDERLLKVRQELALCAEATQTLYSQLLTNTTPDAVAEVSRLIDVNTSQAKQFEREQADVELRKLEFQALRP